MINILGISAYYHDSAAALLVDGTLKAAAQEERFSRKKHDPAFPTQAINYCLSAADITLDEIDYIVFYDKPLIKFERLLETYLSYAPRGFMSFLAAMPVWLKEKLFLKDTLRKELSALSGLDKKTLPALRFTEHHQSHAASAFFPSPFKKAAVLCIDGVGEWSTTSVWLGEGNQLTPQWEIKFPHSLGLLYSAFTYYAGFRVNSGEYKLMGLAPYGEPRYVEQIYQHLIDVKEDGSFRLNMKYFNYATGLTMTNAKFHALFEGKPRPPESEITQKQMDLARSIQVVTEEIILRMATSIKQRLKVDYLCMAGGVALNCVANGKLLKAGIFKDIWIQAAAGDAGGSVGAAYAIWYEYLQNKRLLSPLSHPAQDAMQGSYLGTEFSNSAIKKYLDSENAVYIEREDQALFEQVAGLLAEANVVGWFQGRMEFGPRALGNRSILGDPRNADMQTTMNLKIKYRESFRPFAPSVKAEKAAEWFDLNRASPYMLLVSDVHKDKQITSKPAKKSDFGLKKLRQTRSQIPAVTHVDYSARVQTVHKETNPKYWHLIDAFERISQVPILINTSFNVRGEPIVNSPEDAYRCFMRTEMDYLVMENIILCKKDQAKKDPDSQWQSEFALD